MVSSSAFNFSEVFHTLLANYGSFVADVLTESIDEVSKEACKKLKQASGQFGGTGAYANGWMVTKEKKRLSVVATVHGKKPTYALAHLLENGHAKRNGGRTAARVHIAPVNDWAQDEVMDRTISKLEKMS